MTGTDTPPSPEFDLMTSEAFTRYREGLDDSMRQDLDLYEQLSKNLRTLRVLYVAYLDLDKGLLPEDVAAADVAEAQAEGLAFLSGRRLRLTRDGFAMLWAWKGEIEPHTRKPQFQALWRRVLGW